MVGFQKYPVVFCGPGKTVRKSYVLAIFLKVSDKELPFKYEVDGMHSSHIGNIVIFNGKIIFKLVKWPSILNSLSDFDY